MNKTASGIAMCSMEEAVDMVVCSMKKKPRQHCRVRLMKKVNCLVVYPMIKANDMVVYSMKTADGIEWQTVLL